MLTISNIVDTIFIVEGGTNTQHPYGILAHYKHTTPRQACANTVQHAMRDFHYDGKSNDRMFIVYLADKYCPPSDDKTGNHNWKVNMIRLLKI